MSTDERNKFLRELPGYVILVRKPDDDKIYGPVENSWSLGIEPNRTFFYWTNHNIEIDGLEWATRDLQTFCKKHPDWKFSLYDARDTERLPVILNWELWLDAHEPSDKTIAGIKNKHEARNLRFVVKGEKPDSRTIAAPLRANVTSIQVVADGLEVKSEFV